MNTRLSSQRGVALPIIAVIASVLLFILLSVGLDMALLKFAQIRLRAATDLLCQRVSVHAPIQRAAALSFQREINALKSSPHLGHAKITRARLIIPTMPENSFDPRISDPSGTGTPPSSPYKPTLPAGFCEFTGDPADESDENCPSGLYFGHSVDAATSFPALAWSNHSSAGNTLGCEIEATYSSFGLALRSIPAKVKAMWWTPVRGPMFPASALPEDPQPPGLTIGIAPQMLTDVRLRRFRFRGTGSSSAEEYADSFQDTYDPLRRFVRSPFATTKFQAGADTDFDSNNHFKTFPNISATTYGLSGTARSSPGVEFDGQTGFDPSDMEEMLTACMNPAILVRNTLLSVIVELASRHGQLRATTEMLVLNSQISGGPAYAASPVKITSFGDDLIQSFTPDSWRPQPFQIPYVNAPQFEVLGAGTYAWQTPFYTPSEVRSAKKDFHTLLIHQLRYCYQLFDYTGTDGSGIARYRDPLISDDYDNSGFEPPAYIYPNNASPMSALPLIPARAAGQSWDQECPWGNGCAPTHSARLTAGEVVSTLGSIQSCPFPADTGSGECVKTPLFPDLKAFIRYAAPTFAEPAIDGLESPGYWSLHNPKSEIPFDPAHTTPAQGLPSHILLVLHSLNMTPEQITELASMSEELKNATPPRPMTIVFIPTTRQQSEDGIKALRQAFHGVDASASEDGQFDSTVGSQLTSIYVLSPYYSPAGVSSPSGDEDSVFSEYWKDLLTDPDNNVVNIAHSIFSFRILRTELKY